MSQEPKLILCPVNIRHLSLNYRAYDEAVAMARRYGAKIIVATVAPEFERNLNITDPVGYWEKELDKFIEAHPAEGVEMERIVRTGATHRQIVKLAAERKVDVIVMEAANPKIKDYLLGTTASHVVAHADCSVYVVRG